MAEIIKLEERDLEHLLCGGKLKTMSGTQIILDDIEFDQIAELVERVSRSNIRVANFRAIPATFQQDKRG